MLRNYLTTALRNFLRHPIYSAINVSGLVLGLACSIFIFLWEIDELSYDHYHPDNDRVFKAMIHEYFSDGRISTDQSTPGVLAEALKAEIPEVEQTARVFWSDIKLFQLGTKANYEYGDYADKSIFEVLNIGLIEGSIKNALPDNNSVAISRKMARRYFKNAKALGSVMRINNTIDLTVTAVFEDLPENVTENFDFILPIGLYLKEARIDESDWNSGGWLMTFVKLREASMYELTNAKIKDLIKRHNLEYHPDLFLFPMTQWRLYNHFEEGKQTGGRILYVISFGLIAVFILVIASINFMNLSTARSANRSREVGIRKVSGASRQMLVRQFMMESLLLSFISLAIALLLVHSLLPIFNDFTRKNLSIDYLDPFVVGSFLGIAFLTGLLAGSYPSFFLSSFRPASVLKGNLQSVFGGARLRKALVVFQFGLSMIIIVCSLVVNDQIAYMRNMNVGFDKHNVLTIRTNPELSKSYEAFRNELMQQPGIVSISLGAANPMEINGTEKFIWNGRASDDNTFFNIATCDADYIPTLGLTIVQGRNFSRGIPADSSNFIVTEEAVRQMGFANPVGQRLKADIYEGEIIGVIKDFHNLGIREELQPTVLALGKNIEDLGRWAGIYLRYKPGEVSEMLETVRRIYKKHNPNFPIEYGFLDQEFEKQFRTETMVAILASSFTVLAIIISGLGLFGLASFNTERRVKEIGVRKVLGASVNGLVVLLCRDFIRLILYAIVLGSPFAYYLMGEFLKKYPYRTELNFSVFIIPALAMLLISIAIISYQSIKAALGNPVDALRSE